MSFQVIGSKWDPYHGYLQEDYTEGYDFFFFCAYCYDTFYARMDSNTYMKTDEEAYFCFDACQSVASKGFL